MRAALAVLTALCALAVCVSPAQSAFPGENGEIAFVSDSDGDGRAEIHAINPDTLEERLLTSSTADDVDPSWSPDGRKLAFTRREATFANVFVMNADGSGPKTNLTNALTSFNTDPAWSPGGNAIAFVGPGDNGTDIYRMNADGTGRVNLTNTDHLQEVRPSWSPDGSKIAYDAYDVGDVYVMNADGSNQTNLTALIPQEDEQASWSPDGTRIAFVSDRDGNDEIYTMNPDGTGPLRLTNNAAQDLAPAWSPDGTRIVFQSSRDGLPLGLYVLTAPNTQEPLVTEAGGTSPDWQPLALGSDARLTITLQLVPASEPFRFDLLLQGNLFLAAAGDGDSRTTTVAPGGYGLGPVPGPGNTLFDYFTSISCVKNGLLYVATIEHSIVVEVAAGDHMVCTITLARIGDTANVVATPVDSTTGATPVKLTFGTPNFAGVTTLRTSGSGPPAPSGFEVAGVYYELSTTAAFGQAEVCFDIVPPMPGATAPTIAHWTGPSTPSTPATYYRNAAGANVPADFGEFACAIVTSFSPFALLVPESEEQDSESPVIACGAADGTWHADNVSIACTAEDAGSGLADPADAAFSLSTSVPAGTEDGNASTGTRQVCDVAGNCATAGPIGGNKVDRKAPALSLPADKTVDATSPAGATVSFAASAADGADPSPTVTCTPAAGSVFAIGTTTVACTATDHVGNATAGSFTVTVLGAKEQLARLVQEVIAASTLPATVKAQLLARIQPLLAAFDPSNPAQRRAVCNGLSMFAAVLRLLSGHGVPPAQATAWIADANRIRAVLGC